MLGRLSTPEIAVAAQHRRLMLAIPRTRSFRVCLRLQLRSLVEVVLAHLLRLLDLLRQQHRLQRLVLTLVLDRVQHQLAVVLEVVKDLLAAVRDLLSQLALLQHRPQLPLDQDDRLQLPRSRLHRLVRVHVVEDPSLHLLRRTAAVERREVIRKSQRWVALQVQLELLLLLQVVLVSQLP